LGALRQLSSVDDQYNKAYNVHDSKSNAHLLKSTFLHVTLKESQCSIS
jgi:hypothetical protein